MRPTRSIPSLSLCSFPVSLPRCSFPLSPLEPYPLFSSLTLRLPSPLFRLYSLSPAAVVQPGVLPPRPKCFLLAVHPTLSLSIPPFFRPRELQKLGAGIKPILDIDGFNRYAVVGKSRTGVFFFFFFLVTVNRWN